MNAQKFVNEFENNHENYAELLVSPAQKYLQQQQQITGAAAEEVLQTIFSPLAEDIYNVSMKCLDDVAIFLGHLRNVKKSPWALQSKYRLE